MKPLTFKIVMIALVLTTITLYMCDVYLEKSKNRAQREAIASLGDSILVYDGNGMPHPTKPDKPLVIYNAQFKLIDSTGFLLTLTDTGYIMVWPDHGIRYQPAAWKGNPKLGYKPGFLYCDRQGEWVTLVRKLDQDDYWNMGGDNWIALAQSPLDPKRKYQINTSEHWIALYTEYAFYDARRRQIVYYDSVDIKPHKKKPEFIGSTHTQNNPAYFNVKAREGKQYPHTAKP